MIPNFRFWRGRPVCVIGGTGFLGWQLARKLGDVGANVRIFGLPPRNAHPLLHQSAIETIIGDVRDRGAVARAVAGCATVFTAAGVVAATAANRERFHTIHRDAIQNVLDSISTETRVVHTSSITTLGPSRNGLPVSEQDRASAAMRIDYVNAKRASERIALDAADNGQDVVVTQPGFLIGPDDHDRSLMSRICLKFWNGRLPVIPPGGVNLIDVRDVAVGEMLAAEHGISGRQYVLGGENLSAADLIRLLAEVGGMQPRFSPRLPGWGLFAVAGALTTYCALFGKTPFPSWQDARFQVGEWYASSERAQTELGFRPRPLRDSLADSFAWHRDQNLVTPRGFRRWWMRPGRADTSPTRHPRVGDQQTASSRADAA